MKTKRNIFAEICLGMSSWHRVRGEYWRVLCLLVMGFVTACSASIPSREVSSQLPDSTTGAHSGLKTQAVEEDTLSLSSPSVVEPVEGKDDYRVGPSDLLQINVFQVPELSQAVRVNSQGFISLPLIGVVQVNGLTSQQLEALLAKEFGEKYLQDPQVSVFIEEYASQRVTVEGAVARPGIYPIQGQTTLLQAIASAQGINEVADQEEIKLFRSKGEDEKQIFYYDIEAIRQGVMPDPQIHADDIIVVSESGTKVFFHELSNYFRMFLNPFVFF